MMNEVLYKIKRAADLTGYDLAWLAIEWYVGTGRSTWRFDKALKRANPEKLVRYMGDDGNYHSAIKKAKRYLQRYCGLEKEA